MSDYLDSVYSTYGTSKRKGNKHQGQFGVALNGKIHHFTQETLEEIITKSLSVAVSTDSFEARALTKTLKDAGINYDDDFNIV